ncbi:Urease accessory protein UreF [Ceraceosorus bombacis]|uniref:Urease accessory protein UreF n=1 Tax=Ceraceosorus bombacis TaxID=401625 RepID=A0A0P1BNB6_9BASI|nr:Urease accessory protein UreF [Ceraceosorus bombacis]
MEASEVRAKRRKTNTEDGTQTPPEHSRYQAHEEPAKGWMDLSNFPRVDNDREADEQSQMDYLLLLLGDSNLPTGGFVASSGLESFAAHGLLRAFGTMDSRPLVSSFGHASGLRDAPLSNSGQLLVYLASSLDSYASTSLPYLCDAHGLAAGHLSSASGKSKDVMRPRCDDASAAMIGLRKLDESLEAGLLSNVARRASTTQGVALLTLHSKAFAKPIALTKGHPATTQAESRPTSRIRAEGILDLYRSAIRRGESEGHLPICWGVFCAALGIQKDASVRTHMFLQARAIVSAAIRMNVIGTYAAHSLLHFQLRSVLTSIVDKYAGNPSVGLDDDVDPEECGHPTASSQCRTLPAFPGSSRAYMHGVSNHATALSEAVRDDDLSQGWAWDWEEEGAWHIQEDEGSHDAGQTGASAPAVTWPLGEILQGRHDVLHSRMFNS